MKSLKRIVPGYKALILTALGLALGTPFHALAQDLPSASWTCGTYSSDDNPGEGSVITFTYDNTVGNPAGVFTDVESATLVFSTQGFTYDTNGNVTGLETIVSPSAGAQSAVAWSGIDTPGTSLREGEGPSATAFYYARISPDAGAPAGATVPLIIHVFGFAECSTSDHVVDWDSYASAYSSVSCGESVTGAANATYDQPYAEYRPNLKPSTFWPAKSSPAMFPCKLSLFARGGSRRILGERPGLRRPGHRDQSVLRVQGPLFVEYSQDSLFTPTNPVSLALQNVSNGCATIQLTTPTNHVYELQASSGGLSTNWQAVALATNVTGTVMFTNCQTGVDAQQFYRARVVSIAQ